MWLLTGGKSFRGAKDAELIRENAGYAVAEGETQGFGKESRIRVFVGGQPGARKARTVHVNGVDYGRAANAAGTFTAVVFDPGHLSLVKGSPEGRRRFLDAALCQLYPGYVTLLRRYSRLVTQKNALLKSYWQTPDANGLLDVFDEKLAESGAAVSAKDRNILRSSSRRSRGHTGTSPAAAKRWPFSTSRLSSRKRALRPCCGKAGRGTSRQASVRRDLTGRIFHFHRRPGGKGFRQPGAAAQRCAQPEAGRGCGRAKITGEHPVMLLDDVLSELDETRQSYLLSRMEHRQTIVTACDPDLFRRTSGRVYRMEGGILHAL